MALAHNTGLHILDLGGSSDKRHPYLMLHPRGARLMVNDHFSFDANFHFFFIFNFSDFRACLILLLYYMTFVFITNPNLFSFQLNHPGPPPCWVLLLVASTLNPNFEFADGAFFLLRRLTVQIYR